ncbi:hypothetical protein AAG570_007606 [Ranatra chinensis]|uniref:Uncharacterized protein n=1 Tax=Ranatra chinensis TaxID=642074 RepID=A0ABD0XTZ6_9HEMI
MTAYIQQGGRRPHFWETSSTKRVMEAIKNKEIEMKGAAELLELSLFKAAEMLNVTVTTLANYLAALNKEDSSGTAKQEDDEEEVDSIASAQQALSKNPDITIVKKEKLDDNASTSVNGN